jgi:glutathione S-transferase
MTQPTAITLHDFPLSIYCQMLRVALVEKNAAHDKKIVNIIKGEQFAPEYLAINPRAVVPSLVVDGEIWTDTFEIVQQLDTAVDAGSLTPDDTTSAEAMHEWMRTSDQIHYSCLLYKTKCAPDGSCPPLLKRHAAMVAVCEADPSMKEGLVPRIESNIRLRHKLSSPELMAEMHAGIQAHLQSLDELLADQEFIAGDTYSLADVMWTGTLGRLELHGLVPDDLPNLARYYANLKARPSWTQAGVVTDPAAFKGPPKPSPVAEPQRATA